MIRQPVKWVSGPCIQAGVLGRQRGHDGTWRICECVCACEPV